MRRSRTLEARRQSSPDCCGYGAISEAAQKRSTTTTAWTAPSRSRLGNRAARVSKGSAVCRRICKRFTQQGGTERHEAVGSDPGGGASGAEIGGENHQGENEAASEKGVANRPGKTPTVGKRIIEGLKQAIAWTHRENDKVRVTLVHVPEVDVRRVRIKMGPPATLRNWEQCRWRPDAPTRVLLAVIAKHPEAVEDVLRKAGRLAA